MTGLRPALSVMLVVCTFAHPEHDEVLVALPFAQPQYGLSVVHTSEGLRTLMTPETKTPKI